jgi:hypothetical protein
VASEYTTEQVRADKYIDQKGLMCPNAADGKPCPHSVETACGFSGRRHWARYTCQTCGEKWKVS